MLRYLSVPINEQFSESVARGKGTDNVQGQIPEHILEQNLGYCVYYPSNLFRNTRTRQF